MVDMKHPELTERAVELLKHLIATPSVSRSEEQAANVMEQAIRDMGLEPRREANNVWVTDPDFDEKRPTLLLNAHIDTVKPVATWTRNPYCPEQEGDTLYGLGSNDCGGGLVSLLQVFGWLIQKKQPYNLIYLASAEEEVSGKDGISRVLPLLPKIDVAIVGEPTGMQPAIAEKGLMVLDLVAHGKSGHAARGEGVNAIYEAMEDLQFLQHHQFKKVSEFLGPTVMNVTVIHAGTQHNVVPDRCEMVGLHSSRIDPEHPLVKRCVEMGMVPFGSPTLSDQALMSFPSFKLGPGQSSRSHGADEFIKIPEIEHAISTYIELLDGTHIG